jgi:acyl-CoA thioester hydrolase
VKAAKSTFVFPVRVYYEDTDAAGVVYYANYLKFIERARTEWLRSIGIELDQFERTEGVVFVVRALDARYDKPARLGDRLEVSAKLVDLRRASFELAQSVVRDDDQLFSCRVRLACVDSVTFRPKPVPASMRDQIPSWKTPSK